MTLSRKVSTEDNRHTHITHTKHDTIHNIKFKSRKAKLFY